MGTQVDTISCKVVICSNDILKTNVDRLLQLANMDDLEVTSKTYKDNFIEVCFRILLVLVLLLFSVLLVIALGHSLTG